MVGMPLFNCKGDLKHKILKPYLSRNGIFCKYQCTKFQTSNFIYDKSHWAKELDLDTINLSKNNCSLTEEVWSFLSIYYVLMIMWFIKCWIHKYTSANRLDTVQESETEIIFYHCLEEEISYMSALIPQKRIKISAAFRSIFWTLMRDPWFNIVVLIHLLQFRGEIFQQVSLDSIWGFGKDTCKYWE